MARVDIAQADVVDRLVAHLRETLGLNDRQCYETVELEVPGLMPKGGEYIVTVALGDGVFDVEHQEGGGANQLTEQVTIEVTVYTRIKLDPVDHHGYLLGDDRRGLLELKRKILQALVGIDLEDAAGDTFLRQFLYAKAAAAPVYDPEKGIGWVSIYFGVDYDWNLS